MSDDTIQGLETLARHAFDLDQDDGSREALRCLANTLLLKPETRETFAHLGYASSAVLRLQVIWL